MRIIDCKQATPEWYAVRAGIPTASRFDCIMTPKTLKRSASGEPYICELIAERYMGPPTDIESYTSRHMEHGIMAEAEARKWYAFERGVDVTQVGFCLTDDGRFGCSPDGLVDPDGGLELKCPMAKTHIKYLLDAADAKTDNDKLPTEYRCQVHGSLIVTGRKWWDFMSYVYGMDPLLIRIVPDAFTKALAESMDAFHGEYMTAVKKIEAMPGFAPKADADIADDSNDTVTDDDPDTALFG